VLVLLACAPSAGAQGFQHRAPSSPQQFAHEWIHIGHGRTKGPEFRVTNAADVHWWMEWVCPQGAGYGMHVNLDLHGYASDAHSGFAWKYEAKVFAYGPPNHIGGGHFQGIEHIRRNDTWTYRFSFHAADACHYGLLAKWN
jgi:hypothetical protein